MRLCLLSLLSLAMSALHRVDDAAGGGAVIALNSTADNRPLWADGRLAVAVAAADGSLIELARPPQTTTLALTTARDDQPFVDVAVVAAARPTTRDAAILAVARVAVPPASRGSVLIVASVRFRGTKVIVRAYDAADGGSRATAISRTGLALPDHLPRPWRADVGGPHARVLINETVLTLDQRAPGAEDAPISVTGDVEPAYTASRVWPASAELALHVADVVLAADCVFWPELLEPLLNAIEAVAAHGAVVLIAVTHRLGRTDAFLEKLRRRGWTASARPRRRDAPQNTDVYEVSFSVNFFFGKKRTNDWGRD